MLGETDGGYDEDIELRILERIAPKYDTDDAVFREWVRKAKACEHLYGLLMESPDNVIDIFGVKKTRGEIASTVYRWLGECELDRIEMDGREGYADIVLLIGRVKAGMKSVSPFNF